MRIKEPNLRFANELTHHFSASGPDISSHSIRFAASDFSVFEAGVEDGKRYESAIFNFAGVVSSKRNVKPYPRVNQAEGWKDYKIVDGPFDQPASDQELYHFNFGVYANSAPAWVDWDIVAVSVHIAPVDKQTLIDFAQKRKVEKAIAKSALEDVDRHALRILLYYINLAEDHKVLLPLYCKELIQTAKEKDRLLEIADLLIQKPNRALLELADELRFYRTEGAAALIRDIIAAGFDASQYVIKAIYADKSGLLRALLDPSQSVRILAAQTLEERNDVAGLILCLQNDSPRVREIAGWYMGINKVSEAADALVKAITTEKFTLAALTHAQVEALRSAIWALGVLRINSVQPYLEVLTTHNNELIRSTALNALSKLE